MWCDTAVGQRCRYHKPPDTPANAISSINCMFKCNCLIEVSCFIFYIYMCESITGNNAVDQKWWIQHYDRGVNYLPIASDSAGKKPAWQPGWPTHSSQLESLTRSSLATTRLDDITAVSRALLTQLCDTV